MKEQEASKLLDEVMATAPIKDLRHAPMELKLNVLTSLLSAVDSGLKILNGHINEGKPEPFEGAMKAVLAQQMAAIELARKLGLLP